jgi:hypothetical protein
LRGWNIFGNHIKVVDARLNAGFRDNEELEPQETKENEKAFTEHSISRNN